jgi:hypothetical protein
MSIHHNNNTIEWNTCIPPSFELQHVYAGSYPSINPSAPRRAGRIRPLPYSLAVNPDMD